MKDWINLHPALFIAAIVVLWLGFWSFVVNLVALGSGWRLLSKRFRLEQPFSGQVWKWQSARMRRLAGYNNCLIAGADPMGLYLSLFLPFRPGHPPLFIPWREITLRTRPWLPGEVVEIILGSSERIAFRIRGTLASRLQAAAGSSWPLDDKFATGDRFHDYQSSSSRFIVK